MPTIRILSFFAACATALPAVGGTINFNRDVRPILSDNCFQCHGPDEKQRKAGLRLDLATEAQKPAKSGAIAVAPGKPESSELLKRLVATDADEIMPPPKTGKKLQPEQTAILRQWIAEGAAYQGHWAFIPPQRPAVPVLGNDTPDNWRQQPIDAFILEKLAANHLHPMPEADRPTLLRRVTLDLTGLPPTPQEADAFLADNSPEAYQKVVDRLLASPRYGERMASQWLDFARYADSNGFQSDTSRQMWRWRDWVINAFNRNLPFDQFTIEQLAGDLLPQPTIDQLVATGFNRNHRLNGEGGRIVEEWFAETVIDRVETTGLTWMAMTLNCCRCHDHKYDPITQKEFYSMFAYFNSIEESGVMDDFGGAGRSRMGGNSQPVVDVPTPDQAAELAKLNAAVTAAEARMEAARSSSAAAKLEWERKMATALQKTAEPWRVLNNTAATSSGGATLTKQPDQSWLASGKNPDHDVYSIAAPAPAGTLTALLVEALPDKSLPNQSVGRFSNGNFVLSDVDAVLENTADSTPQAIEFSRAEADYEQNGWPVASTLADKPQRKKGAKNNKGWAVDGPTRREPSRAMFVTASPVNIPDGAVLKLTLRHDALSGHNMGRFRISTSTLPAAALHLKTGGIPPGLREALAQAPDKRSPEQSKLLDKAFSESPDSPLSAAQAAATAAKKARDDFENTIPTCMVMKEATKPREARWLKRGEYDKPQEAVPRAVPAVFPPLPQGAPNNRLGFAQWLVSGAHPLTARVWVNRAWERFFGAGLVKTTENLGSQSEWPSHPELLDWLATEFVRLKWDMKALQREILLSAAYRQSSRVKAETLAADPENRLVSRGPRFRLNAEMLRDQALFVSGLLVEKTGGPSVKPYMPDRVWDETSVYGDMRNYQPDKGEGLYRRTLYTIWKRTAAPPSMLIFDSPSREICTVKRSRTNTPLQALALLNEITFVEAARVFAQRMLKEGGDTPRDRISWAFRLATARQPAEAELSLLAAGLERRLQRFKSQPDEAKKLLTQGAAPSDAADPAEIAAYVTTANVLLNLDEVVTRN